MSGTARQRHLKGWPKREPRATRDRRRPLLWVLLSALIPVLWTLTAPSASASRLRVLARTHLTMEAGDDPAHEALWVGGQLKDSRGKAVANQPVSVTIREERNALTKTEASGHEKSVEVQTSASGLFRATFSRQEMPRPTGAIVVTAAYIGDATYAGVELTRPFALNRASAQLKLELQPMRLSTDLDVLQINVFAGIEDNPLRDRRLQVTVDGRPRLRLKTKPDGWAEGSLETATLLPLGMHKVKVTLQASPSTSAASAEMTLQVIAAVRVSLKLMPEGHCPADHLCVSGRVTAYDGRGVVRGLPGCMVRLDGERTRLAQTLSGEGGRFQMELAIAPLRDRFSTGLLAVVAVVDIPMPYHEMGLSDLLVLELPAPNSIPSWIFLAILLLLLGGVLWQRWLTQRRQRRLAEKIAAASAGLPTRPFHQAPGEAGEDRRRLRGTVLHGESGDPIAASLSLSPMRQRSRERERGDDERKNDEETRDQREEEGTGPKPLFTRDGRFCFEALCPGRWHLSVDCREHERLEIEFPIPHDGTLDGCELLPKSQRALARSAFSRFVQRFSGRSVDWTRETPRDAEARWLRSVRHGHREVREATEEMDRATYGTHTDDETVETLRDALDRAGEASR